eukprot:1318465-Amorphochlora_amoeboformis.AAC.1
MASTLHAKSLGLSVATRQEMEVGEDDADEILPLLTAVTTHVSPNIDVCPYMQHRNAHHTRRWI